MHAAGLLLTGGTSSRMGVPKATLRIGDERLVDRTARILAAVCAPVVEVGPGHGPGRAVRESPPGSGPLAALVTGADVLAADGHDGPVVVVAVDLPAVSEGLLRWLVEHPSPATVVPVVEGFRQPLCARYAPDALVTARELVATGERSLQALLRSVDVVEVGADDWGDVADASTFADVDTPADAARAGIDLPG